MPRISQKDLDALRIGIAQQEAERIRKEAFQQNWDTMQARTYLRDGEEPQIVPAVALMVGDVLLACDGGPRALFYHYATVQSIGTTHDGKPVSGDLWVEYAEGASGGSAVNHDHPVLILKRTAA